MNDDILRKLIYAHRQYYITKLFISMIYDTGKQYIYIYISIKRNLTTNRLYENEESNYSEWIFNRCLSS